MPNVLLEEKIVLHDFHCFRLCSVCCFEICTKNWFAQNVFSSFYCNKNYYMNGNHKNKVKNTMFEITNGIYFIEYVSANIFRKYVKETKLLTITCETQ